MMPSTPRCGRNLGISHCIQLLHPFRLNLLDALGRELQRQTQRVLERRILVRHCDLLALMVEARPALAIEASEPVLRVYLVVPKKGSHFRRCLA
jgi:hypothetical protein